MSSLTMVEAKLPPGFRFHPRDDELVCDYLMKKWNGCESPLLIEVDLNKCEPWDIPETACVGGKEWYFYNQRDRKYATGLRTNRATASGYWKATGKDRPVVRRGSLVGMRKTLVFYQGRAPKGKKTEWVMHEFRVEGRLPKLSPTSKDEPSERSSIPHLMLLHPQQEDWVLCRVFYKNRSEVCSKTSVENDSNSIEETSSSSGLPLLMDSYITFNQTQVNAADNNVYQQVPCFSITSSSANQNQNHPNNNSSLLFPENFHMYPNNDATQNDQTSATTFGCTTIMPNDSATLNISPLACDRKVLEAVLTQLTKMDTSPNNINSNNGSSSIGEVASSESYLSEVALPHHMSWNHY